MSCASGVHEGTLNSSARIQPRSWTTLWRSSFNYETWFARAVEEGIDAAVPADALMRIRWTEPAVSDLTSICDYIEEQNGALAARRIARSIYERINSLQQFPRRGRL